MTREQFFPKYLLVVVDSGITSDVCWFVNKREAFQAFDETAHDLGYKPDEINESEYHLSVWEYTEDKYELIKD